MHLSDSGPADSLSSEDKTGRLTRWGSLGGKALVRMTQKLTLNSGARGQMGPIV